MSKQVKPLIDYVAGNGYAKNVKANLTRGLSKVTGVSEYDLTRKRDPLIKDVARGVYKGVNRLKRGVGNIFN